MKGDKEIKGNITDRDAKPEKLRLEFALRDLKGGDIGALDEVYRITSRGVYLLAYSILKNAEKAEDAVQNTYLRVAENIGKYGEKGGARAWILTIARNLCYREYGNAKRTEGMDGRDFPDGRSGETAWTDNILLGEALNALSAEEREIVTLFAAEGYKHREIARVMGKPMGTVQWIYNRAIRKLRRFMESKNDG